MTSRLRRVSCLTLRLVALATILAACSNPDPAPIESDPDGGIDLPDPDGGVTRPDLDAGLPPDAMPPFPFVTCDAPGDALPRLVEDRGVYAQDPLDVLTLELDVPDLDGLAAVNEGVDGAETAVVLHDGDFAAAGALRIRGGASRTNEQKNYKVELDGDALWHGQREINLNKHMWDLTR